MSNNATTSPKTIESSAQMNLTRSARIESLRKTYALLQNGEFDPEDRSDMACLLADIRHWCDQYGIDFYASCAQSHLHYLEEKTE
jgi:hypothetical protein